MTRGMAIPADNCRSRQGKTLFWADDVDDPLLYIGGVDIIDAEFWSVPFQRLQLLRAFGVSNRDIIAVRVQACRRRQIVVRHG